MEALAKYLAPVTLGLEKIFLDPNNPRFAGSDPQYIPDTEAASEAHQEEARRKLIASFDVKKLQANIEINGFLPIDRVIVRKVNDNVYVVIEGNRRICAAKLIKEYTASGEKVSAEVRTTLGEIDCLLYTGDNSGNQAAWIFQGLRHISGITDWSAFNKAKLLVEQMETENLTLTDVGKRFGLTPFGAGQWVRGFHAFRQAVDETEYGAVIDEKLYPYLQELFGRSSIAVKEWLGWSDSTNKFSELANLNEFVSWFYPAKTSDDSEAEGAEPGDNKIIDPEAWERRVVSKRDEIRQIGFLLREDTKEWLAFRHDKDLEGAYSRAMITKYQKENTVEHDFMEDLFASIRNCSKLVENTPISVLKNEESKKKLDDLLAELKASIALVE